IASLENDGSLDDLAAHRVGHAGDGGFHHGVVLHQGALHLEGPDAVAGGLDDVVGAAHVPVVAPLIAPGEVARVVYAVVPDSLCALLIVVVAQKHAHGSFVLRTHHDFAHLTGRAALVVLIHDVHIK